MGSERGPSRFTLMNDLMLSFITFALYFISTKALSCYKKFSYDVSKYLRENFPTLFLVFILLLFKVITSTQFSSKYQSK